jgi:hypothetical protein
MRWMIILQEREEVMRFSLLSLSSSSLPLSFLPLNFSPCFLSLIPIHPSNYLSPSFLSVILTTSPSFIPFNPPPHYLFSFL